MQSPAAFSECYKLGRSKLCIPSLSSRYENGKMQKYVHKYILKYRTTSSILVVLLIVNCLAVSYFFTFSVSKRFQKFVLDKRLWEDIDLSQEPLPLGILEDMLERTHEKTRSIKLRGPSPSQHIEGEIQHFNKTLRNSLTSRCTKLLIMELFGVTLDFNQVNILH